MATPRPYAMAATWPGRPMRTTVRCRVNLVVAQTQQLDRRLKIDAARGIAVALILSTGLWATIVAAAIKL